MSGRTPINITANTVYHGVDDSDDQFKVFVNASLLLRGFDVFTDDAIAAAGLARVSGQTSIDDGLTLENSVTFANAGMVTQNGDNLVLDSPPPTRRSHEMSPAPPGTSSMVRKLPARVRPNSSIWARSNKPAATAQSTQISMTAAVRSRSTVRWILCRPSTAS
jgi:hypothetical protein